MPPVSNDCSRAADDRATASVASREKKKRQKDRGPARWLDRYTFEI